MATAPARCDRGCRTSAKQRQPWASRRGSATQRLRRWAIRGARSLGSRRPRGGNPRRGRRPVTVTCRAKSSSVAWASLALSSRSGQATSNASYRPRRTPSRLTCSQAHPTELAPPCAAGRLPPGHGLRTGRPRRLGGDRWAQPALLFVQEGGGDERGERSDRTQAELGRLLAAAEGYRVVAGDGTHGPVERDQGPALPLRAREQGGELAPAPARARERSAPAPPGRPRRPTRAAASRVAYRLPPAPAARGRRGVRAAARCSPERARARRRARSGATTTPARGARVQPCRCDTANTLSYKAWFWRQSCRLRMLCQL